MKKASTFFAKAVKAAVEKTLTTDANSTSCTVIYQPKTPAGLESFKKNTDK